MPVKCTLIAAFLMRIEVRNVSVLSMLQLQTIIFLSLIELFKAIFLLFKISLTVFLIFVLLKTYNFV